MNEEKERKPSASMAEYLRSAKDAFSVFGWMWKEITTPYSRSKLYKMFIALGLGIIIETCQPWLISLIFLGLLKHNREILLMGIIASFVSLIFSRLCSQWREVSREWVGGLHAGKLDERITAMFFEKSIGQHIHEGSMLSVSNIDKGRWKFIDLQTMLLFDGVNAMMELIVALVFLCCLAIFAGYIMIVVIGIYVIWSLFLNFKVDQVCTHIDRDFRAINRYRLERWEKVERVKVSGKEKEELEHMNQWFEKTMGEDRNFWIWFIGQCNIRGLFNDAGVIAITAIGSYYVWHQYWGLAALYPLFSWTARVSGNMWKIRDIEHQINWNMPPVKSMIEALSLVPTIVDVPSAIDIDPHISHKIEFKNISHVYPSSSDAKSPHSLKNVSFKIEKGENVALLGPSGAGKTTVMRKILRFDDPTQGNILVDNIDLKNISQKSWRQGIGYIPQQSQVFDGTIRYNLTYRMNAKEVEQVTDERLWELMRLLQIDFKERLTEGLDTVIGKNGIKLSGGQSQRLMIGAAVIKRPWLLVIDEATSSLDSVTEHNVQEGLSKVLADTHTSALIVAHRLSTVRSLCSKFIILKSANQVLDGESQVEAVASTFEELYALSPTFRLLADYQGVKINS